MRSYADFNAGELAFIEPLPIFERNIATERYLDDKQVMQEEDLVCQFTYFVVNLRNESKSLI